MSHTGGGALPQCYPDHIIKLQGVPTFNSPIFVGHDSYDQGTFLNFLQKGNSTTFKTVFKFHEFSLTVNTPMAQVTQPETHSTRRCFSVFSDTFGVFNTASHHGTSINTFLSKQFPDRRYNQMKLLLSIQKIPIKYWRMPIKFN